MITQLALVPEHEPAALPTELTILTDRELNVFLLIAAGLSNPQIAARLLISGNTVKTHVSHVF